MKAISVAVLMLGLWSVPQTFRVNVEGVAVDVLVTDDNRPIAGRKIPDFELRDSGVLQQIDSVALEDVPLNVMLALDTSASVEGEPLEHLKEAATAVARLLRPNDRAALLTFAGAIRRRTTWTNDQKVLDAAISAAEAEGTTALYDAAYAALTLRDAQPGRTLVLIFSDGDDTASWRVG